jgi:hypothetical protein
VGTARARHAWLSITPEPERELPAAVAALRAGAVPDRSAVDAERRRVERLITHGTRSSWTAYIAEAAALESAAPADGELAQVRELVLDVIENHDNLRLGLPGGRA